MDKLVKMKLTAFNDVKFSSEVGNPYRLMLNPESLKWDRSIEYNHQQPLGSEAPSQNYKATHCELLSFDIVIDCTGVVDSTRVDLLVELENLKKVVYEYNGAIRGENHRDYWKRIFGSSAIFQGSRITE